jgi:hypothetical protein
MKMVLALIAVLVGVSSALDSPSSPPATLTDAEAAAVQTTLDSFYSLVTADCKTWVQTFTDTATFYHPKSGVVTGVENFTSFCTTIQGLFKVQEFRQDGPFTWVSGAADKSRLNVLAPALYLNDSPYVNSQHQFFEMVRVDSTTEDQDITNNIVFKVDKVSELLSRNAIPFTFPSN